MRIERGRDKLRIAKKERMHLITVLLPKRVLKEIERYCDAGFFSCRSEAIRTAVYVMLNDIKRFERREGNVSLEHTED